MTTLTTRRRVALGFAVTSTVMALSALGGATASAAIVPSTTTTTVGSSANPSVVGQTVTFTATVTKGVGTAIGAVQFLDAGSLLDSLPLVSGAAQLVTSSLPQGSHDIVAAFVPDPLDVGSLSSVSAPLVQVVNAAGVCVPGQTTPTPTIVAPHLVVGPNPVTVHGVAAADDPVDLYQQVAGAS